MSVPASHHEVPFLKLLLPLMLGIAIQGNTQLLPPNRWLLLTIPVLFAMLLIFNYLAKQWQFRWVYGLCLYLTLVVMGMLLPINFNSSNKLNPSHSTNVLVKIADTPQKRVKSYRTEAQVIAVIDTLNKLQPCSDKLLLYFSIIDTLVPTLNYGDVLALRVKPQAFEAPQNPYQFNFAQYMQRKGISFSAFIADGQWLRVANRANPIMKLAKRTRARLLDLFKRSNLEPDELAVVSALTVGYKDLLDDELRKTYSAAGATHILAVSGLHVGIIYGMMVMLLTLIPKLNRHIKMLIAIAFLWFFAFITGLSPSVLRAAAMFSMVEVGRSLGFRTNTYNTLAAVAFILLLIEPNNLFNLGFQLSFLAVLSIVFFHPHIRGLFYSKSRILSWIWDLISVSIAAQIGTLPVVLFNFGQFSNYFLISNMIAIPMASVILYLAVLLIIVSAIPFVSTAIAALLGYSVSILNAGLKWVEELPFSLSNGLYCNVLQLVILIIGILFFAYFLEKHRAHALQAFLGCLCLYFTVQFSDTFQRQHNEVVVFTLPRQSALCVNQAHHATFFSPDTAADLVSSYGFFLSGYVENEANAGTRSFNLTRFQSKTPKLNNMYLRRKNGLAIIGFDGRLIAYPYNDSARYIITKKPLEVDLLMVNRYVNEAILNKIRPKVAVFDGSVWTDRAAQLAQLMKGQGIETHNLQTQGAYRLEL